ncbi:DUF2254 family protein [Jannaschia sp. 2305UL9-9]|uniref:DUF2254 family protein n=1 Tax=Jannaschia sp. 2305UL9-9 TaxID=3121638 RepID=UPI0035277D94
MLQDIIRSTGSFVANRLLAGIWGPSLAAMILMLPLALGMGLWDRSGLSDGIARIAPPLAFDAAAASDHFDALLTVQIAILGLYFSITLLVLTLAASSLGTRLIERWIARIEIRFTLMQWMALVTLSLMGRFFVAEDVVVPRGLILLDLALTLAALGWLGFGYHRLARTAHVDTSVADIGETLARDRRDWPMCDGPDPTRSPDHVVHATSAGYLGAFDRQSLIDAARDAGAQIALRIPDGEFLNEGDPLAHVWGAGDALDRVILKTCEMTAYRNDHPTGPFGLTLLVELAARALSSGINDHQTAATCVDWIGQGLCGSLRNQMRRDGWLADDDGRARLHVPDSGIIPQWRPYLTVLHRATAPHPFVAGRLMDAYIAARKRARDDRDHADLTDMIGEVAQGALRSATPFERDALTARMTAADIAPAPTGTGVKTG